ncbi:MAG TPA: diguanylate cyclase [Candidatus Cybelea sp.]|nr:diguanylate cyclase [Candidatus Cybelea sp.]
MAEEFTPRAQSPIDGEPSDFGLSEIKASQRKIERRTLWVWGNAIVVILALTAGLASLSASLLLKSSQTIFGVTLGHALNAMVVLVLIFTAHMIFQNVQLRRLQRALAEQRIQAEVFRRLAMFDALTGLYNRRFGEQRLNAEIARSERRGHSLVIVLLDLNGFKEINDSHGHAAGDRVLKEFAERLAKSVRGSDLAVRWGGDEFMLLLVDCNLNQLQHVLMRLVPFEMELGITRRLITFAAGWQEYTSGDTAASLLERTDRNLYVNKQAIKTGTPPVPAAV